jgi:hypothetical protein
VAGGGKFLEAVWRYYNLVDFAISLRHPKAAMAIRLAVDDAEGLVKGAAAAVDPDRLREPFRRIVQALTDVIEAAPLSARRDS